MNDVRKGVAIVLEGEPYLTMSAEFLRKQQRRPVVRATLKHLGTGRVKEHTFMQSDKIMEANIERKPNQFLYADGNKYTFMDQGTYEQAELGQEVVGEMTRFLLEGQEATLLLFDGAPVAVELPIKIDRKVITAPPGVKGDTSTNVMKEIEVEGGVKVKAPLFIKEGDTIRIDTRSGQYLERATGH